MTKKLVIKPKAADTPKEQPKCTKISEYKTPKLHNNLEGGARPIEVLDIDVGTTDVRDEIEFTLSMVYGENSMTSMGELLVVNAELGIVALYNNSEDLDEITHLWLTDDALTNLFKKLRELEVRGHIREVYPDRESYANLYADAESSLIPIRESYTDDTLSF
jgi:hypothetical protein